MMKKKDFVKLLLGTVGGLLFSLGMCMCLLPEWGMFNEGVAVAAAGAVPLLGLLIAWLVGRKKTSKTNWKLVGKVVYGVIAALVLGVGMCMIMVWEMMIPGILVGIVGIVLLLCMIPMCVGLK